MFFDLKLDDLKKYLPNREEPKDFSSFWSESLKETRSKPLTSKFERVDFGLKTVETYDVTFSGYNGQDIRGWYIKPANSVGKIPCVVEFIGYGGGRSFPIDWLLWSAAGYAHFVMDTRGQGCAWTPGDTPDIESDGASPFHPGFMTKGILSPKTYFYKRVFIDGARAVDLVKTLPEVDKDKVILTGGSQGGGITIAVGYLIQDVAAIMPDVPFLCGYRAATEVTDADPYGEITRYLKIHRDKVESTFKTLSYFDGVNFSANSKAPALFSAGLMDIICPPRTVFAAYNHYAGKKEIKVYEYNNHEGGGVYHHLEKLKFAAKIIG